MELRKPKARNNYVSQGLIQNEEPNFILRDRYGVIAWRGLREGPEQVFKSRKQTQS